MNFLQDQRVPHMHTVVPPLVHVIIFTHQNLAQNHPILIETISFHENKHFFFLKTSFSIFEFFARPKGPPHAYCGPPFGPCHNFHSSKSCSKPSDSNRNYFLSWKQAFFLLKNKFFNFLNFLQDQRVPHMHTVVPPLVHVIIFTHQNLARNHPILIQTISFHENKHFFFLKTSFSIFEFLARPKGPPHAYCGPPFGSCHNFHSSKSWSKPSDSNRNYFLSWKQAFFLLKNKFFNFWIFCKTKGSPTCILWSPLWFMS